MVDFVDSVKVRIKAGTGGPGCASIRREKFKPLAGPNGGSGGSGGSVIMRGDSQVTSLLDFHFSKKHIAPNGEMGYGGDKDGKKGESIVLNVPLGTVLKTTEGQFIREFVADGEEFVVCEGGAGGLGNAKLASKQRKAPGFALLGIPGEEAEVKLELKLLADVALVGFPSAGKSSIIAAVSAARPKIADYPFTTLTPNLGVVSSHGFRFTVADVPGLIPGASQGKGLGLEFLRHIERTSVIAHVIDCATYESGRDPISDLEALCEELAEYDKLYNEEHSSIVKRPRVILLNKVDDSAARDLAQMAATQLRDQGETVFLTSAATKEGLDEVIAKLGELVSQAQNMLLSDVEPENGVDTLTSSETGIALDGESDGAMTSDQEVNEEVREVIKLKPIQSRKKALGERNDFKITLKGGEFEPYYEVVGEKLRNWVLQTDFSNDEAVGFLADRLAKIGVEDELNKMGAKQHDEVRISIRNIREPYLITEQEFYIFNYEPTLSAGAEVLYANRRGDDMRLEMAERAQRPTRQEKREMYHQRQDERTAIRSQFEQEREAGYWAEPDVIDEVFTEDKQKTQVFEIPDQEGESKDSRD
jgi:GTP-binding protein